MEADELAQLTKAECFNTFTVARHGNSALFIASGRFYRVEVETGEETVVADRQGVMPDALRDSVVAQSGERQLRGPHVGTLQLAGSLRVPFESMTNS